MQEQKTVETLQNLGDEHWVETHNHQQKHLSWLLNVLKYVTSNESAQEKFDNKIVLLTVIHGIKNPQKNCFPTIAAALQHIRLFETGKRMKVILVDNGDHDETEERLVVDVPNTFIFANSSLTQLLRPSITVNRSFKFAASPSGLYGFTVSRIGGRSDAIRISGCSTIVDTCLVKTGLQIKGFTPSESFSPCIVHSTFEGNKVGSGCFAFGCPNLHISDCTFTNNGFNGCMLLAKLAKVTIKNCKFYDNARNGINSEECMELYMDHCKVSGNKKRGIKVAKCNVGQMKNVESYKNEGNGLLITDTLKAKVNHCSFLENAGTGIHVAELVPELYIADTLCQDNGGSGIHVALQEDEKQTVHINNSKFNSNKWNGISLAKGVKAVINNCDCNKNTNGLECDAEVQVSKLNCHLNSESGYFNNAMNVNIKEVCNYSL